jgi:hypothetical protein
LLIFIKVNSTENALNNNIKLEDALNKLNENQQKYEALLVIMLHIFVDFH